MFALGFLALLALVVFALMVAAVVIGVIAIAKNKPGLFAACGLAALMALGIVVLPLLWVGVRSASSTPSASRAELHVGPVSWERDFGNGGIKGAALAVSMPGLLLVVAFGIALLVMLKRKASSNQAACEGRNRGRGSPLLALLMIGLICFLGARWHQASESPASLAKAARQAVAAQQRVQQEMANAARQAEECAKQAEKQIDQMPIHELMDKVDAPRIPLPPEAPAAPAAPVEPAAPAAVQHIEPATAPKANTESNEAASDSSDATSGEASADDNKSDHAEVVAEVIETVPVMASERSSGKSKTASASQSSKSVKAKAVAEVAAAGPDATANDPVIYAKRITPTTTEDGTNLPRPEWLNKPTKRYGNTWQQIVEVGEYATEDECREEADKKLKEATAAYVRQFAAAETGGDSATMTLPTLAAMGIGLDYIRREIVTEEYVETVEHSFGPMMRLFTRLEFTKAVDAELHKRWDAYRRESRVLMVGKGAGSVFVLLGLMFGLLKVDTMTKGYYTKRLFLGVPAAIIGGFLLLVFWGYLT